MSDTSRAPLAPRPGGSLALAPSDNPLVARALSDLAPATRRVLVEAPDELSAAWIGSVVRQHGYEPVGNARHVHPSDLLGSLPFDVAFIAGRSLSFLREARALLPDEIPIVYELGADAGKADTLAVYAGALEAGAAFVQWPHMVGYTSNLADALTLARFLRDHPEACGWPAEPPPDPASIRFLVVNDGEGVLGPLTAQLEHFGYCVSTARDGVEALERLATEPVDVLWTNERMPRLSGSDLLAQIHGRVRGLLPCVIDSGCSDGWSGRARLAFRCMPLPWDIRDARAISHEAARLRRAFLYARSPRVVCGLS